MLLAAAPQPKLPGFTGQNNRIGPAAFAAGPTRSRRNGRMRVF
ncbi:MAG: hypothetical protein ACLTGM_09525 [Oscillospiraceae bacterium]